MNGIIYCIKNKINGKCYIGQTTIGLKQRYQLNWWKKSHNPYIKHSVEKYKPENFEFQILESNITSIEKLNELESHYAITLNTYIPNGYNMRKCGDNRLWAKESKDKLSDSLSHETKVKEVLTGKIIIIKNFRKFCKETC